MTTVHGAGGLTFLAEAVEAEMMYEYMAKAPVAAKDRLGIAVTRIGGGVVVSARHDPYEYWSKALGFTEPVTGELIAEVIDFYRRQETPTAVIQVAPWAIPGDWADVRATHGLEADGSLLKVAAPVSDRRAYAVTDLDVRPVDEHHAPDWAHVAAAVFGMEDPAVAAMIAQSVHHPAALPFAAWDGDQLVAAANLYLHGLVGSLNTGATLASHRGRGAQSALITARVEAARAAGITWVVAEADQPAAGQANQSLRNLERAGLRPLYVRQSWRWRASRPT